MKNLLLENTIKIELFINYFCSTPELLTGEIFININYSRKRGGKFISPFLTIYKSTARFVIKIKYIFIHVFHMKKKFL